MITHFRYFGQSVYNFMRNELNYPLPCVQTLREWSTNIKMHEGVLHDVVRLMGVAGSGMSERDRVTIVSYDEIYVEQMVEYDFRNDGILGPHKSLQVIMARGLFAKWKQPVYARCDTKMTPEILNQVIAALHEAGYNVVAAVSDCGGGNQGLWKELGIDVIKDHTRTKMPHPVTGNPIHMIPDAPHLLKLIRNWLLDCGFYYKGKKNEELIHR